MLFDERVFVGAFEQVVAGSSPYLAEPYNYPAAFALLGASLLEAWGLFPVLVVARIFTAFGLALTAWWAVAFLNASYWTRLATAIVFVVLAPPVAFAFRIGNLQFLVTGLLLSALFLWPRRPALAGLLLAASCLIKPIGVFAGFVLFFHRSTESTRRHMLAAAIAGATVLVTMVSTPYLREFWQVAREPDRIALTLSVHRIFHSFGYRIDPRGVAIVVLALGLLWSRTRRREPWAMAPLAMAACLAATPVLWSHSLILALPLEAMAFTMAWARRARACGGAARWELPLVTLAIASLWLSEALTRVGELPPLAQLVLALPVIFAPFALAFFVDRGAGDRDQRAGASVMITAE